MPFNPNIPQATDRLAKSQQDLLQNNQQLDTSFGINHYTFSDLTVNNGMHKQCQMVEQAVAPVPGAGTDSLFTKVVTLGELFFVRGGGGTPIQMTRADPIPLTNNYTPESGGGPVGAQFSAGATFLPGNLIYQYGTFINGAGMASSGTIKFLKTFTTASSVVVTVSLICKIGGTSSSRTLSLERGSTTTTQFNWNLDSSIITSYVGLSWTAVGN